VNVRSYLAILFLAFFTPCFAHAAESIVPHNIGPNDVLRGRFVQERHLTGFKNVLRSEGHFVLAPSRGLIWQAETPFAMTTVITASGLAQEVNGNQTLRLQTSQIPFLARLYDIVGGALAGNWSKLDTDFTVSRAEDDKGWRVFLTPKKADDLAMPFRSIDVHGTRFVETVTLAKPDGDFDQLTFLDQVLSGTQLTETEAAAFGSVEK
jgi:hypothetical protein